MTITVWIRFKAKSFPASDTNWTILDCERYQAHGFLLRVNGSEWALMHLC